MGAKSLCIPVDQPEPKIGTGNANAPTRCINPKCSKDPQSWTLFGRSYWELELMELCVWCLPLILRLALNVQVICYYNYSLTLLISLFQLFFKLDPKFLAIKFHHFQRTPFLTLCYIYEYSYMLDTLLHQKFCYTEY